MPEKTSPLVPYAYQETLAKEALEVLRAHSLVYLAMEERTGKSLTALLMCEEVLVEKVLIITKKKALEGWRDTLARFPHIKDYTVTNYHQASKVSTSYDLIILDESHNYISGFPKTSKLWKDIARITPGKPIIYVSATPYAQGTYLLYHQFKLSSFTPWSKWTSAYSWFSQYGVPNPIWLNGRQVEKYDKAKDKEVLACCDHLFITKTRKDLGFVQEPLDHKHYVLLSKQTKELYNTLQADSLVELGGVTLVADTSMKLRTSLHMLEGGVAKVDEDYFILDNAEKIQYIKKTWGDSEDIVIMYNYIAEGTKLRGAFDKAEILQATSFAEGVDLSHKDTLIIYSQDFSTARHTQRRARQANRDRSTPINVHFLLVKDGISDQVYTSVTERKINFVDSVFIRREV